MSLGQIGKSNAGLKKEFKQKKKKRFSASLTTTITIFIIMKKSYVIQNNE